MKDLFRAGHISELDGLRALAVLMVLCSHIADALHLSLKHWNIEWISLVANGWSGVDLFFVLSGFLIGGQILQQMNQRTFSFGKFYLRRMFRILPSYFVTLFVIAAIGSLLPGLYSGLVPPLEPLNARGLWVNFLLMTDYFPHDIGIGSWSLGVEEKFYWIIPVILLVIRDYLPKRKARLFLGIWLLALIFRMFAYRTWQLNAQAPFHLVDNYVYYPFHTRMDGLAAGVLIAIALPTTKFVKDSIFPSIVRFFSLTFILFVVATLTYGGGWVETTLQYSILSAGFALWMWAILAEPEKQKSLTVRFLNLPIWVPVARLSYSLYLTHWFIVVAVAYLLREQAQESLIFPIFVMVALSFFSALLLYLFVEKPILDWIKKKTEKSESRDLASAQAA